jgi:hypothetical protein
MEHAAKGRFEPDGRSNDWSTMRRVLLDAGRVGNIGCWVAQKQKKAPRHAPGPFEVVDAMASNPTDGSIALFSNVLFSNVLCSVDRTRVSNIQRSRLDRERWGERRRAASLTARNLDRGLGLSCSPNCYHSCGTSSSCRSAR